MTKFDADTHVLTVEKDFNILKGSIWVKRFNRRARFLTYMRFAGFIIERVIVDVSVLKDFTESQMWQVLSSNCTTGCTIEVVSDKLYFPKLKKLKFK
jgi:hypothetical protein